ncbi:hypothetical protein KHP62_06405 [Rhodobacteraceae bacterium NNCM2]|nr:hypothetical protein [Coraliihabitans acroporae]
MTAHSPDTTIVPRVLEQLQALPLQKGRPLVAVDADEVLVLLAAHLKRFLAANGIDLRLTEYRLVGTMFPDGDEYPLPFDESLGWIDRFFEDEVLRQEALPGAADALRSLSADAQVMVLTNVPQHGREKRVRNLASLGMEYPLVENSGGKGLALAWMAERVAAPIAFIDDSPNQIESAKTVIPEVTTIHFTGARLVNGIIPESPHADHRVTDWTECEAVVRRALAL